MKESISYTVTLNIAIVFITIILGLLIASLIFFKSNKVSNVITNSLEKYEGFNSLSEKEINSGIASLGYGSKSITCSSSVQGSKRDTTCNLANSPSGSSNNGKKGYCIYFCEEGDYYYYKIRTNMMINIPVINEILNVPIYTNTNRIYDFSSKLGR